ncbi:lysophospholipid acyltransferase family protein [Anatilimnocola sp. NA78]|uniref:lysophospholipid acyltransferase family protein n=1 Tax=Anatilimnocola sp. NA78 TaxID=3415683 RepID=UPI003CE5AF71
MARKKSSWKARVFRAAAWPLSVAFRTWYSTLRVHHDVADPAHDPRVTKAGALYATWHEDLFVNGNGFNDCNIHVMISSSSDGDFGTNIVKHLGYGAIRGSSGRNGVRALREMIRNVEGTNVGITPDGPKGPRRVVKEGATYIASRTGMPVVAMGTAYSCATRFSSWDRMALAWPGTRAVVCLWPALVVPAEADAEQLKAATQQLQNNMFLANERAQKLLTEWVNTGQRPAAQAAEKTLDTPQSEDVTRAA